MRELAQFGVTWDMRTSMGVVENGFVRREALPQLIEYLTNVGSSISSAYQATFRIDVRRRGELDD